MNEATSVLFGVAEEQRVLIERLDRSITGTMQRVHGMERLTDSLERRTFERVPAYGPVLVRDHEIEYPGTLMDLSLTGIGCRLDAQLDVPDGHVLEVVLTLRGVTHEVRANAVRVDVDTSGTVLGLLLHQPSPSTQQALKDFLAGELDGIRFSA
jgi:hypothetical protein